VAEEFRCDPSVPVTGSSLNRVVWFFQQVEGSSQVKLQGIAAFSFEENRKIKANYLHTFIINLWYFKYFHAVIIFGLRFAFFTHISGKKRTVLKYMR